jgi:hypothetical protein
VTAPMATHALRLELLGCVKVCDGHWMWTSRKDFRGVPILILGIKPGEKKIIKARRAIFEMFVRPIPEGQSIVRTCQIPDCVNPMHMEACSHRLASSKWLDWCRRVGRRKRGNQDGK